MSDGVKVVSAFISGDMEVTLNLDKGEVWFYHITGEKTVGFDIEDFYKIYNSSQFGYTMDDVHEELKQNKDTEE